MSNPPPLPGASPPQVIFSAIPVAPLSKLCPHCLAENEDSAHMCRQCLTPMTFFAATVPVFSIWSEMDTFRKASQSPTKLIVVIGMWIIWGTAGITYASLALGLLAASWSDRYPHNNPLACVLFLPLAAIVCIAGTLVTKTTTNYFKERNAPPPAPGDQELDREALAAAPNDEGPPDVMDE